MSLFLVDTDAKDPLNSDTGGGARAKVADFVTKQTFASLALSSAAVKAIWEALKQLDDSLGKVWIPLVLCVMFGLAQFLVTLRESKDLGVVNTSLAFIIAAVNSLILWSAVLGSQEVAGEAGVDITASTSS